MRKTLSNVFILFGLFLIGIGVADLTAPPAPAQSITRSGSNNCGSAGQVLFNSAGACTSNSGLLYDGTNLTIVTGNTITREILSNSTTGGNLAVLCDATSPCTLTLGTNSTNETITALGGTFNFGASASINLQTGALTVTSCSGCASPSQGASGTINTSDGAGGWAVSSPSVFSIFSNGAGGDRIQSVQNTTGEVMLLENLSGPTGTILNFGTNAGGCATCGTWVLDQAGDVTMGGLLTVGKAGNASGGELSLVSTVSGGVDLISDNSGGGILTLQTFGGAAVILNNVNQIFMGSGTQIQSGSNGTIKITDNGATTNGQITVTKINGVGVQKQIFTSSGTFTISAGVTQVTVTVVAGGGAGGGSTTAPVNGSGGGAGGASIKYLTGLTPGGTLTVTVGAGGTGVASTAGHPGVASSVSSGTQSITTISTNPGGGGNSAGSTSNGGAGGAAGTGGDLNYGGGGGGIGIALVGGPGANSLLGGGGGSNTSTPGIAGIAPGAGGGGSSGATGTGGAGAGGIVIFEWVQ